MSHQRKLAVGPASSKHSDSASAREKEALILFNDFTLSRLLASPYLSHSLSLPFSRPFSKKKRHILYGNKGPILRRRQAWVIDGDMEGQLPGEEPVWVAARPDRVGENIEIKNPQNTRWTQDAPKHITYSFSAQSPWYVFPQSFPV